MSSIVLPSSSFTSGSPNWKKQTYLNHLCVIEKASACGSKNNIVVVECKNNKRISTFNYRTSAGVPLHHELPWASFDQYIEDKGRVIRAIFPKKSTSHQLNEEEWRVKMNPIPALFLTCQPVIHITARCITKIENYPPEIPDHISKVLEVQIIRWELQNLHVDYIPQDLKVNGRGTLYLEKKGLQNLMKNNLDISLSLSFPPLLSWVPHHVLHNIFHSILRNYMEDINHGLAVRLSADYDLFKGSKKLV